MDIVLRATAMFVLLYALIRLLGKRELGQMTPFELVLTQSFAFTSKADARTILGSVDEIAIESRSGIPLPNPA